MHLLPGPWARSTLTFLLLVPLAGCTGTDPGPADPDPGTGTGTMPDTPTALEHLAHLDAGPAYGIWLEPPRLYLTSPQEGLRIVDVSDPGAPAILAADIPDSSGRDVEVLHHPDGRDYAVVGRLRAGVAIFDVTDPTHVTEVAQIATTGDGHNLAIVPDTTYVWVAHSVANAFPGPDHPQGYFEVIDLADPAAPRVKEVPFPPAFLTATGVPWVSHAVSCHHFDFSPERGLGFCAAVTDLFILDATDPWSPTFVQVVPADGNQLFHAAWSARNGTLLLLGDEGTGAVVESPLCSDKADVPTSTVWFYDIADLAAPTPVAFFALPYDAPGATADDPADTAYCSAHLGRIVPGRDILTAGWYDAGSVLIDFSDLSAIRHVHAVEEGSTVWEAVSSGDLLATGDARRGTDLYRIV